MEHPMLEEHQASWITMCMMIAATESGSIQTYLQDQTLVFEVITLCTGGRVTNVGQAKVIEDPVQVIAST